MLDLAMKQKTLLFGLAAFLLTTSATLAQTTLAKWTFESSGLGSFTPNHLPGAGNSTTNFYAEEGLQAGSAAAIGKHTGAATYTSPAGNGSAKALSANTWTNNPGDYWQFTLNTLNYEGIVVSFDQISSATGPRDFSFNYSTDGVNFTPFGSGYVVLNNTGADAWSATTPKTTSHYSFDLSTVTPLNNASTIYFRLVDTSTNAANGTGTVASGGTDRIDNFIVTGTSPGVPTITSQPQNSTIYFGDGATFSVNANGSAPLIYQWYFPDLNTPLVDGSSGYGSGTISGATNQTLTLAFVNTNQAGNYRVVVSNSLGAVTSQVAQLTVNVRPVVVTNIAYLHSLRNTNYVLTDSNTLFQADGIVVTDGNLVSGGTPVYSFFIQDATGGIDVFHRGGFSPNLPSVGQHVRVTAPLAQFNGLLEMLPVGSNPSHSIELLDGGNTQPLPSAQYLDFTTIDPVFMENTLEGSLTVISNVWLGLTNSDGHILAGGSIFATNSNGKVFRLSIPTTTTLDIVGQTLPDPAYAKSVTGVMSQNTSAIPLTNGYNIVLTKYSQTEFGTPPPPSVALQVTRNGGNIDISWTTASSGFVLESTPSFSPVNWQPVGQAPVQNGNTYTVSISNPTGNQFYRLHAP